MPVNPSVITAAVDNAAYRVGLNGPQLSGVYSQSIGNPTRFTIGNRFLSGAVSTAYGVAFDVAMACAYSRFLTQAEQYEVACWMLSEFGLLPAASGGTSGFTGLSGVGRLGT
jgi:hypothetical protein